MVTDLDAITLLGGIVMGSDHASPLGNPRFRSPDQAVVVPWRRSLLGGIRCGRGLKASGLAGEAWQRQTLRLFLFSGCGLLGCRHILDDVFLSSSRVLLSTRDSPLSAMVNSS